MSGDNRGNTGGAKNSIDSKKIMRDSCFSSSIKPIKNVI